MTIRDKMLNALQDVGMDDHDDGRLVDMLVDKIHRLEKALSSKENELLQARIDLRKEKEVAYQDAQRMRNDPTYWQQGQYGFTDGHMTYLVIIGNGNVDLMKKDINTPLSKLQPISPREFFDK